MSSLIAQWSARTFSFLFEYDCETGLPKFCSFASYFLLLTDPIEPKASKMSEMVNGTVFFSIIIIFIFIFIIVVYGLKPGYQLYV